MNLISIFRRLFLPLVVLLLAAEADAEYGGGVAGAEAGAALFVAAHVDFTQRARQAAGVEKSQQVLTEGKHVAGIGFLTSSDLSGTGQVTKIR